MKTEELDALIKSVKELTDAAMKAGEDRAKQQEAQLEAKLAAILANHPGHNAGRKIQFADGGEEGDIIGEMKPELKTLLDRSYLMSKILRKPVQGLKSFERWSRQAGDLKKALDTLTSTEGGAWVPTGFSDQLIEKIVLELKVGALFETLVMPTNPYVIPIELADISSSISAENTADSGQTNVDIQSGASLTGGVTLTAKAHVTEMLMSKEVQEDSIIPIMPLVERRLVRALSRGREDFMVNGDTSGTHMDTDTTGTTNRRKAFQGLRAAGYLNGYTTDLSTLTFANALAQRAAMGVYGVAPAQLAYVTSMRGYIKLLTSGDEVITLEKYGPNATILTGELAKWGGIPVIVSEFFRQDLASTGIYGAAQTKSGIILVHRGSQLVGVRRDVETQVLVEKYAEARQDALLVTERVAFHETFPTASNHTLDYGINVG